VHDTCADAFPWSRPPITFSNQSYAAGTVEMAEVEEKAAIWL
jgi:hypothetical protein